MFSRHIRKHLALTGTKEQRMRFVRNISFIERYDPKYVIILSGDQICKQDYNDFLEFHKEKGAEFSVGSYGSALGRSIQFWSDGYR